MTCVRSSSLVCASSKTYLFTVSEECMGKIEEWLGKNGRITARYGPLVKGLYQDAIVTLLKPDKIQLILQFSKLTAEDFEKILNSL
ncbi:MAG: hypothetical protein LM590_00340 [Thermofilum sp.]|jgi:hypothetical protein|nr:hypothetical protein [Thermofilum sp.]